MHVRAQLVSIAFAVILLVAVFELVRRRHFRERYALVWMSAALGLLVLAVWKGLLHSVSRAVGIYSPANAFLVIAFAFLLLLLLHFSGVVSRMADQNRTLAQRLALLEERERADETRNQAPNEPLAELANGEAEPEQRVSLRSRRTSI
jgi:hypothetical protein